jgi:type IV pilus assembly protein PilY1
MLMPGTARRSTLWLRLLVLLVLLMLSLTAGSARASPPVLKIASEPLTAACSVAVGGGSGGAVLHGAAVPAPAGSSDAFQASFDTADWSGHLERFALLLATDGRPSAAPATWDAGALLTGSAGQPARPSPQQRKIYTSVVQADGRSRMVPFEWDALSDAQRALLELAPPSSPSSRPHADGKGALRLAFLRGERDQEGVAFRRRGSVLGDAVHSTPQPVGPPAAAGNDAAYAAFYQRYRNRAIAVYLGANDGMLHAFDASDGSELFAYVPDALFPALNLLTSAGYQHRAYVDGPAGAGAARIGNEWKTVLVSAMGGGAQGVFALDVSDPSNFDAGLGALWEFTDRDDPMMGNVTTPPQIARFRVRKGPGGGETRDFAVVASGLDNYANDGHRSSAGNGALFLLALDKRADEAWRLNVNYYRLVTPISESAQANGLGAPALVADTDGAVRYAYAGDLQGNLWRFDFSGNAPWSGAVGPGPGKKPLFVARDAKGTRQPISQQPRVAYAAGGGYLVLFGTGRMITTDDRAAASFATQSYYGILDGLSDPAVIVSGRNELTPRVLSGTADASSLVLRGDAIEAGSKGWYFDFLQSAQTGERSFDSGVLVNGQVLFNTLVPGHDTCAPSASRTYALDVLVGQGSERVSATLDSATSNAIPMTGILQPVYAAAPLVLPQPPSGSQPPPRNVIGQTRIEKPYVIANTPVSGDRIQPLGRATGVLRAGRLSWREVANWRELHEAAIRTP